MAIGFESNEEKNYQVPETSHIGFDDIQISQYLRPSLSTIGASRFAWGSIAATQLIDFLDNETPFQIYRIPTKLIQRESSKIH
jgi:LacI family transcriptional regulator